MRAVALTISLFLAAGLPALASPYDQVVVFGDSNVDNGNFAAAAANLGMVLNPPPNYGGRNNNGPVVVEYLANNLGVPLDDRAFSGATTGNGTSYGFVTNTLTQVTNYVSSMAGVIDPKALYVYWAGSNDLLGVGSNAALLATSISTAVGNIGAAIGDLTAAGAGTIVVANRTPRTDLTSQDNSNGIALNAAIAAAMPGFDLGGNVVAFDDYSVIANLITNGASEGFTHTAPADVCINIPACANNLSVASSYVFWDSAHKTTAVHAILADAIEAEVLVPEPPTVWLMLGACSGLVGAAFLRRLGHTAHGGTARIHSASINQPGGRLNDAEPATAARSFEVLSCVTDGSFADVTACADQCAVNPGSPATCCRHRPSSSHRAAAIPEPLAPRNPSAYLVPRSSWTG